MTHLGEQPAPHPRESARWAAPWRPLAASICLHFAVFLSISALLLPPRQPPKSSEKPEVSVTLAPAVTRPSFDATPEGLVSTPGVKAQQQPAGLPSDDESPLLAASSEGGNESFLSGGLLPVSSATSLASPDSVRTSQGAPRGKPGLTEADERLMQADIDRYLQSLPPSGPETEIELFGGRPIRGHSFAFLIDRSASTASKHSAASAQIDDECSRVIEGLPVANRFQLLLYNDRVSTAGDLLLASPGEKAAAKERLLRFAPSGGTMHLDGLRAALRTRANHVFWFSDGGDPYLKAPQIEEMVRLAARSKTIVHAWRLGRPPADGAADFMKSIAEQTGGTFHEGAPPKD